MKPFAFYNENDPKAAEWLRNLIAIGAIADGDVDERSIEDVRPSDLEGYTQCHFFAGIGGWPLALRLAGWPDDRHVWTGSCPCQPFSNAGRRKGNADSRHLFPAWHWLIGQCRPAVLFGEQVASKAGREWLAGVQLALEALGFRFGAADLCAAGVGAPQIRQRLFWVADAAGQRHEGQHALLRPETAGQHPDTLRLLSQFLARNAQAAWLAHSAQNATLIAPLSYGEKDRIVKLRGFGNAIVPQLAAKFIEAYLETL